MALLKTGKKIVCVMNGWIGNGEMIDMVAKAVTEAYTNSTALCEAFEDIFTFRVHETEVDTRLIIDYI